MFAPTSKSTHVQGTAQEQSTHLTRAKAQDFFIGTETEILNESLI